MLCLIAVHRLIAISPATAKPASSITALSWISLPSLWLLGSNYSWLLAAQVYGVVWNPFMRERDSNNNEVACPSMMVTHGVKHIKFWVRAVDSVSACSAFGLTREGAAVPAVNVCRKLVIKLA